VNWTKNVSFNQDANPVKVVKGVDVYEMSVDVLFTNELFFASTKSSVEGVECRKVDYIFDMCRLGLVV
jgi:hypothetical protein